MVGEDVYSTGEVRPEYAFKTQVLILHSETNDALEEYVRLRFNKHEGMRVYDAFLSRLSRLYSTIRPKLKKVKDDDVEKMMRVLDHMQVSNKRLEPEWAVAFFNALSEYLEIWGVTKVEKQVFDKGESWQH